MPVFNDWASFERLLDVIDSLSEIRQVRFHVIAVDDGSSQTAGIQFELKHFARIASIEFVHLVCNLGHQRAIAVGLVLANQMSNIGGVIVMDCDGEDCPEDIPRLLAMSWAHPDHIICAQRVKRSEALTFRIFYALYKATFRSLTGARIDFGNYCLIPVTALRALVHNPAIWNNLAAAIVRSRIPFHRVPTERGQRYAGQSSMNLVALILHGLSAMSVYSDVTLIRLILLMLGLSGLTVLGLMLVVCLRFLTDLAIPGWASSMAGSLLIILLQSLIFSAVSAFVLLSTRSTKAVIPVLDSMQYVLSREQQVVRHSEVVVVQ